MAFVVGTASRNLASRAFLLRSPRDTPLPLVTNVVLVLRWDTEPDKRIREGVPHAQLHAHNAFLCRGESVRRL
jgi:hypothetical protein